MGLRALHAVFGATLWLGCGRLGFELSAPEAGFTLRDPVTRAPEELPSDAGALGDAAPTSVVTQVQPRPRDAAPDAEVDVDAGAQPCPGAAGPCPPAACSGGCADALDCTHDFCGGGACQHANTCEPSDASTYFTAAEPSCSSACCGSPAACQPPLPAAGCAAGVLASAMAIRHTSKFVSLSVAPGISNIAPEMASRR